MSSSSSMKIIPEDQKMNIGVSTGQEVLKAISSRKFGQEWDRLFDQCSWATVFQSREFVSAWYQTFQKDYTLILVTWEENAHLKAILPLAVKAHQNSKHRFIVVAGHGEADCQCWLSSTADSDQFIQHALEKLMDKFPNLPIMIRNIPPEAPMNWVLSSKFARSHCVVESFRRPLLDFDDFHISKRNRKRLHRLKEIGSFSLIKDKKEFLGLLPELTTLYDFRQGAMFNRTPYRNNPAYSEFLELLFEKGLIMVAVLKSQEEVIAALILSLGKENAHLGAINAHSPLYAAYSPGYFIFLWLCQELKGSTLSGLDLTPGEDFYKDRLSTHEDQVKTLIISSKTAFILKRKIRKSILKMLLNRGMRPLSFLLFISKQKYQLRQKGVINYIKSGLSKLFKNKNDNNHLILISPYGYPDPPLFIKKNSMNDLMDYDMEEKGITKWDFLKTGMSNLEKGMTVFTYSSHGCLLVAVWLDKKRENQVRDQHLPEKIALLQNLYFHSSAKALVAAFLQELVLQLINEHTYEKVYLNAPTGIERFINTQMKAEIRTNPNNKRRLQSFGKQRFSAKLN